MLQAVSREWTMMKSARDFVWIELGVLFDMAPSRALYNQNWESYNNFRKSKMCVGFWECHMVSRFRLGSSPNIKSYYFLKNDHIFIREEHYDHSLSFNDTDPVEVSYQREHSGLCTTDYVDVSSYFTGGTRPVPLPSLDNLWCTNLYVKSKTSYFSFFAHRSPL